MDDARPSGQASRLSVSSTTPISCPVGERPGYFVPGDKPLALLGCARLGVSGERVEFSGNVDRLYSTRLERFYGEAFLCINPAYSVRGHIGTYIPARCKLDPPPQRFDVQGVERGLRDSYELVIWGTGPESTTDVVALFSGGEAKAAVFRIRSRLAQRFGEQPFSLFVLELPLRAGCTPTTVETSRPRATARVHARTALIAERLGENRTLEDVCEPD